MKVRTNSAKLNLILLLICVVCHSFTAESQVRIAPEYKASIPVVIHVIYNKNKKSVEDVQDSLILKEFYSLMEDLKGINGDTVQIPDDFKYFFKKPNIDFYVAKDSTTGKELIKHVATNKKSFGFRKPIFRADPALDHTRYLNIYIGRIRKGKTLGYVAGLRSWENANTDGVAIHYSTIGKKSRVFTHEVGHWLGLAHIFKEDNINDTPVQIRRRRNACPNHPHLQYGKPVMFMNFMDYSSCRVMFTNGQVLKMHWVLENYRTAFLNR